MFSKCAWLLVAAGCAYAATAPDPRNLQAARLIEQGKFMPAVDLLRELYLEARNSGVVDEHLAETAADLGGAYIALERFGEAEALANQAMDVSRKLFGEAAPQTARHSMVLAKLYLMTGRVREAEAMLVGAKPILEGFYGKESTKVAALLNHLGLANDMLGRVKPAAEHYREAIRIYEKTDGQKRLAGIAMSNLIAVLVDSGEIDEAVKTGETSLMLLENWFGPDHPYLARTLHSLGTAYQGKGQIDAAQRLYQRALAIWQKNPGMGTLDTATVEASLGAVYTHQGYYAKAEVLLKKSAATKESILGANNADLSSVLSNLGYLYAGQGRLTDARQILEKALGIAERTIGPSHPRALPIMANLAWVHFSEGRYHKDGFAKAEDLYRRVLTAQEQRYGPYGIEVSTALANLAETCAAQKRYKEAKQLEERALAIRRTVLGENHPETVRTQKQYTFLLRKSKD